MSLRIVLHALYSIILIAALVLSTTLPPSATTTDGLYKLLGVPRSASTQDIKTAYRRAARDTHPDKQDPGTDAEEVSERFRQVVHAFEVLSDDKSRRRYDQTGNAGRPEDTIGSNSNNNNNNHGGTGHYDPFFHFHFNRRPIRMKDRKVVQEAMGRVMHVVSLEQLETIMLDDDGRLERNLLICFVTPGDVETKADNDFVFPYPFAGMSPQKIWWEDLLQTVKIRYHKESSLAKFFGIPHGDEMRSRGLPAFVFARRGDPLTKFNVALDLRAREDFETWTWRQIEADVTFKNDHDYAVELYWIHGTRGEKKATIEPNTKFNLRTMLTHEFYGRDVRIDNFPSSPGKHKLSHNCSVGTWKILDDTTRLIVIPRKNCLDLSGHCSFWQQLDRACDTNPTFMNEFCRLTCGVCSEQDENVNDSRRGVVDGGDDGESTLKGEHDEF